MGQKSGRKFDEAVGLFLVSCKFREVSSGFIWAFTGVYGPLRGANRRLFWEELSGIYYLLPVIRLRGQARIELHHTCGIS